MEEQAINPNYYDKIKIYHSKIKPLVDNLKIACNLERIPMFFTAAIKNSKDGTDYDCQMVLASSGIALTEDRISSLLLRLNDFRIEPPLYIQKDIRELTEYLDRISVQADVIDMILEDNKLDDMKRGTLAGGHVSLPKNMDEKPITDEFLDD